MSAPTKFFEEYRRFGRALKKARLQQGLTQKQAAALVGLHETSYRGVEAGKQGVYLRTAYELCSALGVDMGLLQQDYVRSEPGIVLRRRLATLRQQELETAKDTFLRKQKIFQKTEIELPAEQIQRHPFQQPSEEK